MSNFLNEGYEIERSDDTHETYYGCGIDEIRYLESAYHNGGGFRVLRKVYEIENEFHKYTFDVNNGTFSDYNDVTDDITEISTEHGIANYLWQAAINADEDSIPAYKAIAIDIFESFEKWRAMAFWHTMIEFERDVDFLKEVTQ